MVGMVTVCVGVSSSRGTSSRVKSSQAQSFPIFLWLSLQDKSDTDNLGMRLSHYLVLLRQLTVGWRSKTGPEAGHWPRD